MTVLTRYFVTQIFTQQFLALLALCLIFGLFTLYEQADQVGRGNYRILDAVWYVVLTTPDRAVALAPIGALFGTMFIVEKLSRGGELTSMLCSGCSPTQLVMRTLLGCLPLVLMYGVTTQWIAPKLYKNAELRRITRISDASQLEDNAGFWIRRDQKIMNIAHRAIDVENNPLLIYELDEDGSLLRQTQANSFLATTSGNWRLFDVTERTLHDASMSINTSDEKLWKPFVSNIQDELQQLPLGTLSLSRLYEKYNHAVAIGAPIDLISVHFWQRVVGALAIAGMAMLVIVFVLTGLGRQSGFIRELGCLLIGSLAYVSGTFIASQNIIHVAPVLASLLPVLFLFIVATVTARRHALILR